MANEEPKGRGAVYVSQDGNVHYNENRERIDSLGHVARRSDGTVERLPEEDLIPLSWFDDEEEEKKSSRSRSGSGVAVARSPAAQAAVNALARQRAALGWGFVQPRAGQGLAGNLGNAAPMPMPGLAGGRPPGTATTTYQPPMGGGGPLPPGLAGSANSGGANGAPMRIRLPAQEGVPGLTPPSLGPGFPAPHEWNAGYQDPAGEARRTQSFGANPKNYAPYGLPGHEGVDWSMPEGTPVQTMGPGVVETVGSGGAYGNYVAVRHPDNNLSYYAHLSEPYVQQGDLINYGMTLGESGNTGNSTGPHLHASIRPGGSTSGSFKGFADPDDYMGTFNRNAPLPVRTPTSNFGGWKTAGW